MIPCPDPFGPRFPIMAFRDTLNTQEEWKPTQAVWWFLQAFLMVQWHWMCIGSVYYTPCGCGFLEDQQLRTRMSYVCSNAWRHSQTCHHSRAIVEMRRYKSPLRCGTTCCQHWDLCTSMAGSDHLALWGTLNMMSITRINWKIFIHTS